MTVVQATVYMKGGIKLTQKIHIGFSGKQFQKEAALNSCQGEYRTAVIKMIACYCCLEYGNVERKALQQQSVPNWLGSPVVYSHGNVPPFVSGFSYEKLAQGNGNELIAYEILNGDFGLAMQSMSAMILGKAVNELPHDMDDIYLMQIPMVTHPWDDLLLDMKRPVQE